MKHAKGLLFVIQKVRESLTDELRKPEYRDPKNPLKGHCYVASEALYHLMGGKKKGWKSMFMYWEGEPHWFLLDADGRAVDVTAAQFRYVPRWKYAKGKGFLTKKPSKRARIVISRVKAMMNERNR